MTEPTTAAGRRLLSTAYLAGDAESEGVVLRDAILAIEAEARQQDASALREALTYKQVEQALDAARYEHHIGGSGIHVGRLAEELNAILAALPPSAPAGLDVERLVRAISASDGDRRPPSKGLMAELRPQAESIAAEYARLEQDHP